MPENDNQEITLTLKAWADAEITRADSSEESK